MYTDTASASGGVGGLIIVSGEINNIVLLRCDNEYPNLDREEAGSWGYFTGTWSRATSYFIVILIVIKGKEVFMLKCSCLNNAFTSIRIIHHFVIIKQGATQTNKMAEPPEPCSPLQFSKNRKYIKKQNKTLRYPLKS